MSRGNLLRSNKWNCRRKHTLYGTLVFVKQRNYSLKVIKRDSCKLDYQNGESEKQLRFLRQQFKNAYNLLI